MSDTPDSEPIKLIATCDSCGLPLPGLSSEPSGEHSLPSETKVENEELLSSASDTCKDCGQSASELESQASRSSENEKSENLASWLKNELGRDYQINNLISKCKHYVSLGVHDNSLGKDFILKIFQKQSAKDVIESQDLTMAELLASLNHPHIQTVYESGFTAQGRLFLLLEDPGSINLESIIQQEGFLDLPIALELFDQASDALYQLHELNIPHGSIRPRSISVQEVSKGIYVAKVTNFSVTKISEDNLKQPPKIGRNYTCLDAFYMSPEELNSVDPDPISEIYSLGCVMFHAITGKPVFRARNLKEAVKQHTDNSKARFRRQYEIPENVQAVVLKMLEKSPEHRYKNVAEVHKDILNLKTGQKPKTEGFWEKLFSKVRNDQNK